VSAAATVLPARQLGWILPPVALAAFALVVGAVVMASGDTLGFDFLAYHQAAGRVLEGERLYDPSVEQTGGFGLFYYPPPFVLPLLPLALLDGGTATIVWLGLSIGAFFAAVALMPVGSTVRWMVVLLAAQMWPVAYTFKLGQVGPILMLAFVIGWRWLNDPVRLGGSAAMGALVKLQPGLILGWAALTGRWRAVGVGIAIGAVATLVATAVVGMGAWFDYVVLLRQVSDPITTPHNFTPGAIAFQQGASPTVGAAVQFAVTIAVLLAVVASTRWVTPDSSFLVAVVASQLLSPVLWDHYAMLLLLPVAWLLERRHWWALLVPLGTSIALVAVTPPFVYPLLFGVLLLGLMAAGRSEHRWSARRSSET